MPAGGAWKRTCPEGKSGHDGRFSFKPSRGASDYECRLIESFRPVLSPRDILHAGAFGGTYFRDIDSAVTGKHHRDAWAELPKSWLRGLDIKSQVSRPWADYAASVNKYGVKCGNTLEDWESSGWIMPQDPYGWFQWYCRFFQGRRTPDDARQISRWLAMCGPNGRWKGNLIAQCLKQNRPFSDASVAPVVRQSLLHWGYELTLQDFNKKKSEIIGGKGAYALPREQLKELHKRGSAKKRPAASVARRSTVKRARST